MESLNMTRDESKALLSVLIDQKEQIEAQTDKLNFRHSRVMSIINELNTMLTDTETKAPAELVDVDWQVGNDRDRLNRINRALQEDPVINKLSDDLYQVVNGNSKIFVVSISGQKGSCTCMDFQKRGQHRAMPCKHMYAVGLHNDAQKVPVNQSDEGPKCIHCEVAITGAQAQELDDMCQRCWLQRQGTGNGVLVNDGGYVDEFGTFAVFRAPGKQKASEDKQFTFEDYNHRDDHPRCVIEQQKHKQVHDGGERIRHAVNKVASNLRSHPLVSGVHINQADTECWKVKGEGAPVLEVWESYNGDLYFITEKGEDVGDVFLYARLYAMPQFAEWGWNNINYLIEQYGKYKLWPVQKQNWANIDTYEKGLLMREGDIKSLPVQIPQQGAVKSLHI